MEIYDWKQAFQQCSPLEFDDLILKTWTSTHHFCDCMFAVRLTYYDMNYDIYLAHHLILDELSLWEI